MSTAGSKGHFPARSGERDGPVGFALNEAVSFESSDRSVGRDVAYCKSTRNFDQSAVPFFSD